VQTVIHELWISGLFNVTVMAPTSEHKGMVSLEHFGVWMSKLEKKFQTVELGDLSTVIDSQQKHLPRLVADLVNLTNVEKCALLNTILFAAQMETLIQMTVSLKLQIVKLVEV